MYIVHKTLFQNYLNTLCVNRLSPFLRTHYVLLCPPIISLYYSPFTLHLGQSTIISPPKSTILSRIFALKGNFNFILLYISTVYVSYETNCMYEYTFQRIFIIAKTGRFSNYTQIVA